MGSSFPGHPQSRGFWGEFGPKAAPPLPPGSGSSAGRQLGPAPGWTERRAHLEAGAALGSGQSHSAVSGDWSQGRGPRRGRTGSGVRGRRGPEGQRAPRTTSPGLGAGLPSLRPRGDADTTTRRPLRGVKRPLVTAGV